MKFIIIFFTFLIPNFAFAADANKICANKKIVAYTKPRCPYCVKLKEFILSENFDFQEINVTSKPIMLNWLISTTKSYTVPYVFMDDKYIGGYREFIQLCKK